MESITKVAYQLKSEFNGLKLDIGNTWYSVKESAISMRDFAQTKLDTVKLSFSSGELAGRLCDISDYTDFDAANTLKVFVTAAVILLVMSICNEIGQIFAPILDVYTTRIAACTIIYLLVPIYAVSVYLEEMSTENEFRRGYWVHLLTCAALEGILTGYIFAGRIVSAFTPLPALTTFLIGIVPAIFEEIHAGKAKILLGVTAGFVLLLNNLIGLVIGISLPYIILTLLYCAIGMLTLQMYLRGNDKFMMEYICNIVFIFAVVACQTVIKLLFGSAIN